MFSDVVAWRATSMRAGFERNVFVMRSISGAIVAEKKKRLAGERRKTEDALNIRDKAHVEHAVGFVNHHDLYTSQQELAAFKMVKQASWCGNENVCAPVDHSLLAL